MLVLGAALRFFDLLSRPRDTAETPTAVARAAAKMTVESVDRIEPARLEELPEALSDRVADLASAALGHAPHPRTAASLADLVRIMNTYYSNLIEGHDTKPRDIERALVGDLEQDEARRNLQIEVLFFRLFPVQ